MALSETFSTARLRIGELSPFKHTELTDKQKAGKAITETVKLIQEGKLDAARLMREIDGENQVIVFTDPEIRLPKPVAYGMLELIGRQEGFHSSPVSLGSNRKVFTHPSVLKSTDQVVFDAVEEFRDDGKRTFADIWAKRRIPSHEALFQVTTLRVSKQNVYKINPAETIDARNGVY